MDAAIKECPLLYILCKCSKYLYLLLSVYKYNDNMYVEETTTSLIYGIWKQVMNLESHQVVRVR